MRRLAVLVVAILLLATACGGDSDDAAADSGSDDPGTTAAVTTEAMSEEGDMEETTAVPTTAVAEAEDGGDDSGGTGPSTATVTLGGETYRFATEGAIVAQCLTDLFGIFSVQLQMVDDSGASADGSVSIVALHDGVDPAQVGEVNAIEVSIGDEDWVADVMFEQSDALEPGMSRVDSVEIDGRTVRGTATFFRQSSLFSGDIETVTGTFEATCGEERTS